MLTAAEYAGTLIAQAQREGNRNAVARYAQLAGFDSKEVQLMVTRTEQPTRAEPPVTRPETISLRPA